MPGPYTDALLLYLRLMARAVAPVLGGIGIFALVQSSLGPRPSAALMAIIFLLAASGLTIMTETTRC